MHAPMADGPVRDLIERARRNQLERRTRRREIIDRLEEVEIRGPMGNTFRLRLRPNVRKGN